MVFTILLIAAGAEDAARLRISNITVLLVIVSAIVAAVVVGPQLSLWQNLTVFAVLLAIGTPLFAAGKLGGGDVKLFAAAGLWFNLGGGFRMVLAVVLAGGLLALLILALRLPNWSEKIRRRVVLLRPGGGIPYGVAIAAGALIAMALQR
nr:prepilin peptidase [Sphingomonas telluris]